MCADTESWMPSLPGAVPQSTLAIRLSAVALCLGGVVQGLVLFLSHSFSFEMPGSVDAGSSYIYYFVFALMPVVHIAHCAIPV